MASKTADQEKLNDPELVSSVEERLASTFSGLTDAKKVEDKPADSDDDIDDSTSEKDDGSQTDDSKSDDDSTPDDDEVKDDEVKDDEVKGVKVKDDEKALPDAFKRAAIHQGWKDKDVDEFFEANPDSALRTFENIYNSTNNLSRKYGDLGRAHRQAEAAKTAKDAGEKKVDFVGVDIAKLKESGVDLDPAVEAILTAQNKQLEAVTKTVNDISTTHKPVEVVNREAARHKVSADATVEQQIRNFFEIDSMAPYKKFYGDLDLSMSWEDLTAGQKENRFRVIEQADLMVAGAAMQGQEMKVDEALGLAHLLVTEPVRERIIRDNIKSQVVKRTKSMVLKPSGKKVGSNVSDSADGKPQSRKELESKTEQRLAKVFSK